MCFVSVKQFYLSATQRTTTALSLLYHFCFCLIFPVSQMSAGAYSYLVFATVCFSVAIYVYLIIPETKNKTFMEISQMFSRKQPILDTQGLILGDQLQLKKMNGYGGLEKTSLDFDSSSSYRN